jgi:hypothetical protein
MSDETKAEGKKTHKRRHSDASDALLLAKERKRNVNRFDAFAES